VPSEAVSALVKFCPVDTGIKILNSQSLYWSAPHLFADPFELQHGSDPLLTAPALLDLLLREALIILFGPNTPTGRQNRLVNTLARWRDENRFCDEEEAGSVLKDLLGQIAELHARKIDEYLARWRLFARQVRIASFCDRPGNLHGWHNYADRHRGMALRFECGPDTGLPDPRPVQYQPQAPVLTTLAAEIDIIFGRRNAPEDDGFIDKLLVKGRHQQGEEEWRCLFNDTSEAGKDDSLWFTPRKFPAHELRAVYLGASMPRSEREHVAQLLRASYPTAKLFQAVAQPGRYELEFEAIARR